MQESTDQQTGPIFKIVMQEAMNRRISSDFGRGMQESTDQ